VHQGNIVSHYIYNAQHCTTCTNQTLVGNALGVLKSLQSPRLTKAMLHLGQHVVNVTIMLVCFKVLNVVYMSTKIIMNNKHPELEIAGRGRLVMLYTIK
jgi:hypothetical protein